MAEGNNNKKIKKLRIVCNKCCSLSLKKFVRQIPIKGVTSECHNIPSVQFLEILK